MRAKAACLQTKPIRRCNQGRRSSGIKFSRGDAFENRSAKQTFRKAQPAQRDCDGPAPRPAGSVPERPKKRSTRVREDNEQHTARTSRPPSCPPIPLNHQQKSELPKSLFQATENPSAIATQQQEHVWPLRARLPSTTSMGTARRAAVWSSQ
jgi:hypothetical protein